MRLVQGLVPDGTRGDVLDELHDEGIDYAVFEETGRGEFEALVQSEQKTGSVNVIDGVPETSSIPGSVGAFVL